MTEHAHAELIYKAVLVSGVLQSDSVIHKHTSTLFQILFPHRCLLLIFLFFFVEVQPVYKNVHNLL